LRIVSGIIEASPVMLPPDNTVGDYREDL